MTSLKSYKSLTKRNRFSAISSNTIINVLEIAEIMLTYLPKPE